MARKTKTSKYDPDTFDDTAALLAKAARRHAYLNGADGWAQRNGAGVHGTVNPRRADRRAARAEIRSEVWA
jgi:hypothetical protein